MLLERLARNGFVASGPVYVIESVSGGSSRLADVVHSERLDVFLSHSLTTPSPNVYVESMA